MPTKRGGARAPSSHASSATLSPPLATALLLAGAVSYGVGVLVTRGRMSWPPHELLASVYTIAGCLALVGPLILARGDSGERGLGDLLWMTGGLLIWVFDAAAALHGTSKSQGWATPLGYEPMGLTMLAVLLGGWRCRLGVRSWSWTNVVGWILGVYWIAMAVTAMWPGRLAGLGSR